MGIMGFVHPFVVGRPLAITSHFRMAAGSRVTRPAASSAVNWDTSSANTIVTEIPQPNFLMASRHGRRPPTALPALLMEKKSALITTSVDLIAAPMPTEESFTSVPSAVQRPTSLSPGPVVRVLTASDSLSPCILPQVLPYRDFSNTIVHRSPLITADKHSDDIFLKIIHPYSTDAFEFFLSKHLLTYFYPLLVPNLRNGFPLGEMPPLTDTVIFKKPSFHISLP
jgi:hypothetical protein